MVYILARVPIRDSDRFHLDVLDTTHQFLKTVKDPINSRVIQHELSKIDELWDEDEPIPVNEDDRRAVSPCPFIASIFVHTWNYSLDVPEGEAPKINPIAMTVENALFNPNVSPVSPTRGRIFSITRLFVCIFADSFTLAFYQRNDYGVTILDISDPLSPQYCYVSIKGLKDAKSNVPAMAPLSAEQYARAYCPSVARKNTKHSMERGAIAEVDVREAIALLADERVMKDLPDAWSSESKVGSSGVSKGKKRKAKAESRTNASGRASAALATTSEDPIVTDSENETMVFLKRFMVVGADLTDLDKRLEKAEHIALIRSELVELFPFPSSAVLPLVRVLAATANFEPLDVKELDLSHLSVSSSQIFQVLDAFSNTQSLNLSHNKVIDARAIQIMLVSTPSLRRLILLDCLSLTNPDLSSLLVNQSHLFVNLSAIIHPLFLSLPATFPLPRTHSFSIAASGVMDKEPYSISVPFCSAPTVVRAITDLVSPYLTAENPEACLYCSPLQKGPLSAILSRAGGIPIPCDDEEEAIWDDRSTVILPKVNGHVVKEGAMFIMSMYISFPEPSFIPKSGYAFLDFTSETSNYPKPGTTARPTNRAPALPFDLFGSRLGAGFSSSSSSSTSSASVYNVLDLRSFLERMYERDPGRERADEESVARLEDMLEELEARYDDGKGAMFTSEEVAKFFHD
ncbi:uncharacterized protein STEHIDRAFT_168114 [Stereum hirsutum FP-91666 SS1]|uniref:uncharacterized protein n=1 Tax=Stereum hirsutum (strain FP-91666) TaxID=721885 RepID=UPI000440C1A0|nr:uncharacterized protein STEHIDRAFT_168114 [Stereum hirsutum FP-91666 SS1]EIM87336.1 hypothetical protein STEHIDRAFT_168114 [Stereum hirsutum FP-91666 SS1]